MNYGKGLYHSILRIFFIQSIYKKEVSSFWKVFFEAICSKNNEYLKSGAKAKENEEEKASDNLMVRNIHRILFKVRLLIK